jgi:enoyl-CoA hydratase/carnithine racemase
MPPVAVQLIKRASYLAQRQDLRAALDAIASHLAVVTATADPGEAMSAFRDRPKATFSGC